MPHVDRLVKTRPQLEVALPVGERARGLVSSRASGQRIEAQSYEPGEGLVDVVWRFWKGRWDLPPGSPHTTELLSDPCLHIVFEEGGPHAGGRLVGAWTKLWRRTLKGRGLVRGAKIRAGAARAFVDKPVHIFTNKITPLEDVFGRSTEDIQSKVLSAPSDDAAFDAFGDWLRTIRRHDQETEVKLAIEVCQLISRDLTIASVASLTRATGLSTRALQRLFRGYVGGTPKWAILRNRMQEAAQELERGETGSLATLAAELGFTDQSHFARDFKRATGKTPASFRETVHR